MPAWTHTHTHAHLGCMTRQFKDYHVHIRGVLRYEKYASDADKILIQEGIFLLHNLIIFDWDGTCTYTRVLLKMHFFGHPSKKKNPCTHQWYREITRCQARTKTRGAALTSKSKQHVGQSPAWRNVANYRKWLNNNNTQWLEVYVWTDLILYLSSKVSKSVFPSAM